MALLPNETFNRNQTAAGRQAVEQTQLRNNAARANTPAQGGAQPSGAGLDLGNAPLSRLAQNTPEFLNNVGRDANVDAGDGILSRLTAAGLDKVTGAAQAVGQGISNVVNNPTAQGSGFEAQRPTPGPGAGIGTLFGTPTAQGSGFEAQRPTPGPGRSPSFPSLPNAPTTREIGQRPGPPQAPGVNGGSVPGAGAGPGRSPSTPTATTPAQVNDDALQGAIQGGGSAAGMGYWAREGGPKNYIPGTQANDSNLSVIGTGNPPGMPAPGTPIVHTGGGRYTAGGMQFTRDPSGDRAPSTGGGGFGGPADGLGVPLPQNVNPNAGGSPGANQVTILGDSGSPGGGGGGLSGAIDAYLNADPGGGAEGSRRRQQLRNVMEALAGREQTNTMANTDVQTTQMTQAGANQRNQADNAVRWDSNNATWVGIEQGMGGDPRDALTLARMQEAYAAGDDETFMALATNSMPRVPELVTAEPGSAIVGEYGPGIGGLRPFNQQQMIGLGSVGGLTPQQRERVLQGGGR